MELSGNHRIDAPRDRVWAALNDPQVLKEAIPGCEEVEKVSDTEFTAKVRAKVGPVSAKFAGAVILSDLNPPESYRIAGEGKGGAAGFARGGANVRLEEDSGATVLHYDVDAKVGGKLAQVGSRLIKGTAEKMANDFFARLSAAVENHGKPAGAPREAAGAPGAAGKDADLGEEPEPEPVTKPEPGPPPPEPAAQPEPAPSQTVRGKDAATPARGLKPVVWAIALVVIVAILLAIFTLP